MLFQSTRPRGARQGEITLAIWNSGVSIHAPTRGATSPKTIYPGERVFQSTRPRGARRMSTIEKLRELAFQSTRPRGARHGFRCLDCHAKRVSIHAPTRGATRTKYRPVRHRCRFNPRAHAGRDGTRSCTAAEAAVSIHAPTRGATCREPCAATLDQVSIHAPTRGATRASVVRRNCRRCFNPRAHAGRDFRFELHVCVHESFNPRAHAGRDHQRGPLGQVVGVSIHAPTRGATPLGIRIAASSAPFQSTRPRGARRKSCRRWSMDITVSIHAPTRGATIRCMRLVRGISSFNPRAHAGRDFCRSCST